MPGHRYIIYHGSVVQSGETAGNRQPEGSVSRQLLLGHRTAGPSLSGGPARAVCVWTSSLTMDTSREGEGLKLLLCRHYANASFEKEMKSTLFPLWWRDFFLLKEYSNLSRLKEAHLFQELALITTCHESLNSDPNRRSSPHECVIKPVSGTLPECSPTEPRSRSPASKSQLWEEEKPLRRVFP